VKWKQYVREAFVRSPLVKIAAFVALSTTVGPPAVFMVGHAVAVNASPLEVLGRFAAVVSIVQVVFAPVREKVEGKATISFCTPPDVRDDFSQTTPDKAAPADCLSSLKKPLAAAFTCCGYKRGYTTLIKTMDS
jgi:hypothetical protein